MSRTRIPNLHRENMNMQPRLRSTAFLALVSVTTACGALSNGTNDSGAETGDADGTTGGGTEATIFQVQGGEIPIGTIVQLNGVVITSPVVDDDGDGTVYIGEPEGGEYSGVALYMWSEVVAAHGNLQVGDVVNVRGEVDEFFDFTQIKVTAVEDIEPTGETSPVAPTVVLPADVKTGGAKSEAYEGVLVRVEDVVCTDASLDYGEFDVTDGLRVDDFFFVAAGEPEPGPAMGATFDAINGLMTYSYEEFKLLPRDLDDLEGFVGGDGDGDGDGDFTATIPEIQGGDVPVDSLVEIVDVVVTTPIGMGDTFYIQDPVGGPLSGIAIFVQDPTGLAVTPGQTITVFGRYVEFNGLSEIEVLDISKLTLGSVGTVPAPAVVAAADIATNGSMAEQYEGVLVTVEGVSVTDNTVGNNDFMVTGDLRVDDFFFAQGAFTLPDNGTSYTSITGPLGFAFDEFRLMPRDSADLVAN